MNRRVPHRQTVGFSVQSCAARARVSWTITAWAIFGALFCAWQTYRPTSFKPPRTYGEWVVAPTGRDVVFTAPAERPTGLYAFSLQTKQVRALPSDTPPLGAPRVSPDNRYVAVGRRDRDGEMGVWLAPLVGRGGGRWLCLDSHRWVRSYDWSSDGRTLFVAQVPRGPVSRHSRASRLMAVTTATGAERVLATSRYDLTSMWVVRFGQHAGHVACVGESPCTDYDSSAICVDPAGGAEHVPALPDRARDLRTADGRRVLIVDSQDSTEDRVKWRIDDGTGRTVIGPYVSGDRSWVHAQIMPNGAGVMCQHLPGSPRDRQSERQYWPVDLLHADGTAEPMFDGHLLDDPLHWHTPTASQ